MQFKDNKWEDNKYGGGYFYWTGATPLMWIGILPAVILGYAGPDLESVSELVADKENKIWAAIHKRGPVILENNNFVRVDEKFGLPSMKKVQDIFKDSKGNIWIVVYNSGVFQFDGKTWKNYTGENGMPGKVTGIGEDKNGNIWIMGKKQIIELKK